MKADAPCGICAHADEHGWWGDMIPGLTHCRVCHTCWPMATAVQHCTRCHRTFTNDYAASLHRRESGPCLDPAKVTDRRGRPHLVVSSRDWRRGTTRPIWASARRTTSSESPRSEPQSASEPSL